MDDGWCSVCNFILPLLPFIHYRNETINRWKLNLIKGCLGRSFKTSIRFCVQLWFSTMHDECILCCIYLFVLSISLTLFTPSSSQGIIPLRYGSVVVFIHTWIHSFVELPTIAYKLLLHWNWSMKKKKNVPLPGEHFKTVDYANCGIISLKGC